MRMGLLLLTILIPLAGPMPLSTAAPVVALAASSGVAGGSLTASNCWQIELNGEARSGQEWSADIGQGWRFRLVPIAPSGRQYTGWDLAVSPAGDGSYPDALLLATPPYGSLSQREIGTTFGLRAQDAIAWEPRRFRFLTSAAAVAQAQTLFRNLIEPASVTGKADTSNAGAGSAGTGSAGTGSASTGNDAARRQAASALLAAIGDASSGELTILDATLIAGAADPPAFAEQWAAHLGHVPHTLLQTGGDGGSPRGELRSVKFRATLSLPVGWKIPIQVKRWRANCSQ